MRLLLCEGKHASSAFEGLAIGLGARRLPGYDPSWRKPGPGQAIWGLASASVDELAVHRVDGKQNLLKALRLRTSSVPITGCTAIGVCIDPDAQSDDDLRKAIEGRLPPEFERVEAWEYRVTIGDEDATVSVLPWRALGDRVAGRGLYRTVVETLELVYPARQHQLALALATLGEPTPSVKELCWSWMARWYSDDECDHFFRAVLGEPGVRAALSEHPAASAWLARVHDFLGTTPR